MSDTKIEWTNKTWNPVTGCTKVSAGCDHCYAEGIANRFAGGPAFPNGFDVTLRPHRLRDPLRWREPQMVFVNSMSDLFHKNIPDAYIAQVFAVMQLASQHTFQVLTKRHGRMKSLLNSVAFIALVDDAREELRPGCGDFNWPLPNVWLGVSVEDQKAADLRIPALLDTPAAVRFLSCEPLVGPVDLAGPVDEHGGRPRLTYWLMGRPRWGEAQTHERYKATTHPLVFGPRIDWVIAGGESGPGARRMELDWAQQLVDQCQSADTAVFVKQLGSAHGSGKGGPIETWPAGLQVREYPTSATTSK